MKKVLAFLLSAILALTFCACGDNAASSQENSITETSSEAVSSEVESEEATSSEVSQITEVEIKVPLLDKDLKTMKRVKILPLGDSFTATAPMAYRYFLYEKLYQNGNFFEFVGSKQTLDTRLGTYYNRHEGTGGHTSVNGLEVYNSKIAGSKIDYDVIILFYGINDVRSEEAKVPAFKENYTKLLNAIFTDRPDAVVFAVGAPKPYTATATKEVVESFKAKGNDITYINMYQRDDVTFDQTTDYITQTVEKGHPNDSGYVKFASVIFEEIKDKITQLNKETANNTNLPVAVNKVTLDTNKLNLTIGEEHDMIFTIAPENADTQSVLWHVSNPNVCEISIYGTVKAIGKGECDVTAVSLDGKAYDVCKVTVSGEKFSTPGDYKNTVFKEGFEEASAWGEDSYPYIITPKTSNMSFGWGVKQAVSLSTTNSYNAGKNFEVKFYVTINANIGNKTDERYVSLTFGDYKLAVGNCASQVVLYYKGSEIGRNVGRIHPYEFIGYTLNVTDGTAYVYRDQELLFKANVASAGETSGKVTIDYNCMTGVGIVDAISIKN